MPQNRPAYLTSQPSILDLGSHYAGARLQGSLQVLGATVCHGYHSPQ